MPESPQLSYKQAEAARDKFVAAWNRKWFKPHTWLRPYATTAIGVPSDTIRTWYVAIFVRKERHIQSAARVARRSIPGIPAEIRLMDYAEAAA